MIEFPGSRAFCDTSFFFASLYPKDVNYERAGQILKDALTQEVTLWTTWEVSNAEEPPLYVLSEPGVNLSAHRAPIIQPWVLRPSASAGIARAPFWQSSLTSIPRAFDDVSTS